MIKIKPRRPLDDDNPDGYLESDKDFALNNIEACIVFLEQELGQYKPKTVYKFTDLIEHATKMGHFWNDACKILECFCAAVQCPELKTYSLERSELEYDDCGNPQARKIAKSWFEFIGNPDCVELL